MAWTSEEQWVARKSALSKTQPRHRRWQGFIAIGFLLPAAVFLLAFVYIPALISLGLGFFHYHMLGVGTTWGGLSDFKEALTYPIFWLAFKNTLVYSLIMIPLTILGSLGIATLIAQPSGWFHAIRTMVLLPYVTPVIATSIGWLWMFNPQYGVLNAVLQWLGLPISQWMLSPYMALPSVAFYSLWHGLGFDVVIMLSALSNVPKTVLEAAAIDGASSWQRFRKVTLPLLSPTLFFLVIITTIGSLQAFSQIFALSGGQGGPEYATTTLLLLIYQTAFQYYHFSYAAAMAILLVLLILLFTLIQNWLAKRWVFYQ